MKTNKQNEGRERVGSSDVLGGVFEKFRNFTKRFCNTFLCVWCLGFCLSVSASGVNEPPKFSLLPIWNIAANQVLLVPKAGYFVSILSGEFSGIPSGRLGGTLFKNGSKLDKSPFFVAVLGVEVGEQRGKGRTNDGGGNNPRSFWKTFLGDWHDWSGLFAVAIPVSLASSFLTQLWLWRTKPPNDQAEARHQR